MNDSADKLEQIALAISTFRSDEAVIGLLRSAFAPGQPRFGAVIVVDSLGSGAIERTASEQGWNVHYINASSNIGSAGNLDLRLRTAASLGLKWCFAVNHDGVVDIAKVEALHGHATSRPRVGAAYPQLVYPNAGDRLDSPRRGFSTYNIFRPDKTEDASRNCVEVAWSSSNCALYNLDAIRDGVPVWPALWMGFEDLALGWELQRRGWTQLQCPDVHIVDSYEFKPVRLLGRDMHLADKPSWYMYYHLRNLLLIARRSRGAAAGWSSIAVRMIVNVGLIVFYRDKKIERLRLLFAGLIAGVRNVSGKGPVP